MLVDEYDANIIALSVAAEGVFNYGNFSIYMHK